MEGRRRLGGAAYRGDGAEIVAMVTPDAIRELPQIAGQAVLVALAQQIPGAEAAARAVITRLSERDWDGDEQLRAQLEQGLGGDAGSAVPSIPVDLDQLVDLLRGGEHHCGGRLNVRTGEALPELMFSELADQVDDDEAVVDEPPAGEWLYVDALGSRTPYRDMERFIDEVVPPLIAGPLREAITGKGAFARFRSRIAEWPDLLDAWRLFSEERWLGRARQWLAEAGYQPR